MGELPRILIVDDEEAILETMTFTFMDTYEVLTATSGARGLELLDEYAPVAVVISDQRMPDQTGSEFLAEVYERHPETVRIILTGFADMDSTVKAINDGHVYAYINKPWEPDELKQVVKRAYGHHELSQENRRLLEDLTRAKQFLQAVMDKLETGAIAIDINGVVQAANKPACEVLHLPKDPIGVTLDDVMEREGMRDVSETVQQLAEEGGGRFEDVELAVSGVANKVRMSLDTLSDASGASIGRVILFKEVSHEPLRRRFEECLLSVSEKEGDLRAHLEAILPALNALSGDIRATGIASPGMAELEERSRRAQTAIQNWLDVDDTLASTDYPDAQLLLDRLHAASRRWPTSQKLPPRVEQLANAVALYYESGENPKQRVL